jgi:hypothetical protein
MDLDARQTRRLFLAGTVAFPTPFPSTGTISFEMGSLKYSRGAEPVATAFVIVQELSRGQRFMSRAIQLEDVSAIFIPGAKDLAGKFQISSEKCVEDFERGEWLLKPDFKEEVIRRRLDLAKGDDITTRDSVLRGVVFVAEAEPVLSVAEVTTTAAEACEEMNGCCCEHPEPCCCRYPYYCDGGAH